MKSLIILILVLVLFFVVLIISKPGDSQIREECTKYFLVESKSKGLNTFEGENQIYNSIIIEDHLIYKSAKLNVLGTVNIDLASAYLWKVHFNNSKYEPNSKLTVDSVQLLRDSLQILFNNALTRLDSLALIKNNIEQQLNDRNSEIGKLKFEIYPILDRDTASQESLNKARLLIDELDKRIQKLESQ